MEKQLGDWRESAWICAFLAAIALVYVLSSGPALWLVGDGPEWARDTAIVVYAPLSCVMILSPEFVSRGFSAYLKWWSQPAPPKPKPLAPWAT
jgi:hypothetical protein